MQNSLGQEIQNTENFWKWFAGSKVVDKNGNPLVVYHGSNAEFDTFDIEKIGSNSGNFGHLGFGFYFSTDIREAEGYGNNIIKAYLKICNPFYGTDEQLEEMDDILDLPKNSVINKNEFLNLLKSNDIKAYKLAELMLKNNYTTAWDIFLQTEDSTDNVYDLNTISSIVEDIKNGDLSEWAETKIKELFPELKIELKPTAKNKSLAFLLDLGQYKDKVEEFTDAVKEKGYDGIIYGSEIIVFYPNQIKSIDNKGMWSNSDNIYETLNKELEKFL